MARLSKSEVSPDSKVGGNCQWCHQTPFRRTVHLLDMLDRGEHIEDVRRHLKTEFPHQAAEWHGAELRSVAFVLDNYGNSKDERNYREIPWVAWQKNKTTPRKIAELKRWLRPEMQEARYEN